MKSYKLLLSGVACALMALGTTSCLEEAFPHSSTALGNQVSSDVAPLTFAMVQYLNAYNSENYDFADVGYMGIALQRDHMVGELPAYDAGYDYFGYFGKIQYLGDWLIQSIYWSRYMYMVNKANLVIGVEGLDSSFDGPNREYLGDAYSFRAFAYFDMLNCYEYRLTDVASLDEYARANDIVGLTVPIVTEKTTEAESVNNPRAPYWHLWRQIYTDLRKAERYLDGITRSSLGNNHASIGYVYGQQARLWMTIASRFRLHPEDMSVALAHESDEALAELEALGVSNAVDAYRKAQDYARRAIGCGYEPLTESQWYDPKTGFNSWNNSWMNCIVISSSDGLTGLDWRSFVSFMSPEASWGVSNTDYNAYRMIDARLWQSVQADDWRRATWIAPEDVADRTAFDNKYSKGTNLDYDQWSKYAAYAGFKFHPANGDCNTAKNGIAISSPLMRVEEMYFIEAEAKCFTEGVGAGKQALESFMNTYRTNNGGYKCTFNQLENVVREIFNQKRIEFWGEGIIFNDYKRLEYAVVKGYEGTNHPSLYRYNSNEGFAIPWSIYFIPTDEHNLNPACKLNPDPSGCVPLWTGN